MIAEAGRLTAEPVPTPLPGAVAVEYGGKHSSLPRQGTQVFTFGGTQGDIVAVLVAVSNAHPSTPTCRRLPSSSFVVKTDKMKELVPSEAGTNTNTTKTYQLPATGRYYIYATCSGQTCNAYCVELQVRVEKK